MDFTKALDVKLDDVERPPLPPIGHYVWKVSKQPTFDTVGNGKWDTVDFPMRAVEAREDVDPEELSAVGGVNSINSRIRFMFNKGDDEEAEAAFARTLFNLKNFLGVHLNMDIAGMELKQAIDQSVGNQCLADMKHRPDPTNPETIYAEIGRTAPVE